MIPLARIKRFRGRSRLIIAMADLKNVLGDLHVSEADTALALNTHNRTNIRIIVLESVHIDTGFKRYGFECSKIGVFLKRRHFINVT